VPVTHEDRSYHITQANNALVFPGLGLGVAVAVATAAAGEGLAQIPR
jgi:malate dehydrogenase (oxaloacetate-decarboxylating)